MGNLNRRSYIRREIDEHDNRVVRVSVTGLGKKLLEDVEV
jgi:DNA-binding MarR family transcriptional regulator